MRQGSLAWSARHDITPGPFADWWAGWVLNNEGTDQWRLRRLLTPAFSRRLIDALKPRFLALAAELAVAVAVAAGQSMSWKGGLHGRRPYRRHPQCRPDDR